jgi:transcriptional regulator with GAF, ATPase, and Fis domain
LLEDEKSENCSGFETLLTDLSMQFINLPVEQPEIFFLTHLYRPLGGPPVSEQMNSYAWPGNVRELRNVVERAMILSAGSALRIDSSGMNQAPPTSCLLPLDEIGREHICDILERSYWRISGKGGAAEILGLVPTTLHSRMKKLGITRPFS